MSTKRKRGDDITALETKSDKSLFYRSIPEHIKAYLIMLEGPADERRFAIKESPVFIGRDRGMDLLIDDQSVSREHAVVFFYDGRFYVRDLKSTNGTSVNGKRVEQAVLNYKDILQIGKATFRFFVEHAGKTKEGGQN